MEETYLVILTLKIHLGLLNAQVDVINPSSELRDSYAKLKINYPRKLVFTKTAPHTRALIQNFQHLQFLIASYNFQNEYWPTD